MQQITEDNGAGTSLKLSEKHFKIILKKDKELGKLTH